jgi:hypothetical protein
MKDLRREFYILSQENIPIGAPPPDVVALMQEETCLG